MLDVILRTLDKILCLYLGVEDHDTEKPKTIKLANNKIILYKNHIFQRHRYYENLDAVEDIIKYPSEINKKIGVAMGKVLAKNLTISFEKVEIKKCP